MYVLIHDPQLGGLVEFKNPSKVYTASLYQQVSDYLSEIQSDLKHTGGYAVGYMTYEAAPAFDAAFLTHKTPRQPLLNFGIFKDYQPFESGNSDLKDYQLTEWHPNISRQTYQECLSLIKHHIAEGDTYQVNYTFKLQSSFQGNARSLFLDVQSALKAEYAAFIDLDDMAICSFSPELFFKLKGRHLISKPMKGTAKRGLTLIQDRQNALDLSQSAKNRAENIMIVDMIRNDMGRIAETGTVKVDNRFDVETQPYVLQMTSTVSSRVKLTIPEIFRAMFPCASITGAPKVRTMELIHQLETAPRGVYTGSIGYFTPENDARFSVAIRTLCIDKETGSAEYGIGSGIVWDSDTDDEYEECLMKADFLNHESQEFQLFESILWTPESGYYLLVEHLKRLKDSVTLFGFEYDENLVRERLKAAAKDMPPEEGAKVRLFLDREGHIEIQIGSLGGVKTQDLKVGLAPEPVDSQNFYLYHKTTNREVYEQARQSRPDCDDVILWNERNEITESCRSNVVAEIDGDLLTPPIHCGLLGGTYRARLLADGKIKERVITTEDLKKADRLFTINSVRRWMTAHLVENTA